MFLERRNSSMPFQDWRPFPPDAIVQVKSAYGESRVDLARNLWWGYGQDLGQIGEGVIVKAKRLDRLKSERAL